MFSAYSGPILELDRVSFRYPGAGRFIDDLAFAIGGGEFIGLLGANGSGKSTILKLAAGMVRPDRGIVKLWDRPLAAYRNKDRAKLLCYFPQHLDVSVPFTVREIVGMGMYPYDIPPAMAVDEAMDTVGLLDKADVYVTNL
ncbi:MAG: transporter, partial [Nitrospirae bacterium]|nr:transporter [Nitrospirota bacterium]